VILNAHIKHKLIAKLLSEIKTERDGGIVDISQMRHTIQMLVELSGGVASNHNQIQNISVSKKLYEQEFERPFIAETQNYYRLESN